MKPKIIELFKNIPVIAESENGNNTSKITVSYRHNEIQFSYYSHNDLIEYAYYDGYPPEGWCHGFVYTENDIKSVMRTFRDVTDNLNPETIKR